MKRNFLLLAFLAIFSVPVLLVNSNAGSEIIASISRDGLSQYVSVSSWIGEGASESKRNNSAEIVNSKFIDRPRYFIRKIDENGMVVITEGERGDAYRYFSSTVGLIVSGGEDLVVSKFDGKTTERKIVYNPDGDEFPIGLLKLLSSLVKHGAADNSKPHGDRILSLGKRSLSMTCNAVTDLAITILNDIGVRSRIVTTLALGEWNSYDNGHTFLEVYAPKLKKWVAIDLDAKVIFSTRESKMASAFDMVKSGPDGISYRKYSDIDSIDYSSFKDYQEIADFAFANKGDWCRRVLESIAIKDAKSGKYVFATKNQDDSDRILQYSPEYMTVGYEDFEDMFYTD